MNADLFVSAVLQASITASGLLLAIFALILPSIKPIVSRKMESYKKILDDLREAMFELEKKSPAEFNTDKIRKKLDKLESFREPLPFTKQAVYLIICGYILSVILCIFWFFDVYFSLTADSFLAILGWIFGFTTLVFGIVAIQTLVSLFKVIDKVCDEVFDEVVTFMKRILA